MIEKTSIYYDIDYYNKTRKLKAVSNLINLTLIFHMVAVYISSIILVDLVNIIVPKFIEINPSIKFVSDINFWNYLINMLTFGTLNIVPFLLVMRLLNFKVGVIFNLKQFNLKSTLNCFIIGLGINYMFAYTTSIIISLINTDKLQFIAPDFSVPEESLMGKFMYILVIVVVAPISEEFLCRGAILHLLKPYGFKLGIVISSLIFSLLHGNVYQMPGTFFMGLILGYITIKQNSIIPAIIMHSLNNGFSLLLTFLAYTELGDNKIVIITLNLFILFVMIYAIRKLLKFLNNNKFNDETKIKGNFKNYFINITSFLLFLVYLFRFLQSVELG